MPNKDEALMQMVMQAEMHKLLEIGATDAVQVSAFYNGLISGDVPNAAAVTLTVYYIQTQLMRRNNNADDCA